VTLGPNEWNGANGEYGFADSNGAACHRKRRCWKRGRWALAARLFAGVLAGLGVAAIVFAIWSASLPTR